MELRERLAMQLAQQQDEFTRLYRLSMDGKARIYDLDFARGVIRGIEMAMAWEELHRIDRAKEGKVVNG